MQAGHMRPLYVCCIAVAESDGAVDRVIWEQRKLGVFTFPVSDVLKFIKYLI